MLPFPIHGFILNSILLSLELSQSPSTLHAHDPHNASNPYHTEPSLQSSSIAHRLKTLVVFASQFVRNFKGIHAHSHSLSHFVVYRLHQLWG